MELIFLDDPYIQRCTARVMSADEHGIRLDQTIFYPTGGGQPGDTGTLISDGHSISVITTQKGYNHHDIVHVPEPGVPLPISGTSVEVLLDWDRRYRHMRMHTCLHLLCAVVRGAVTGGQIGAEKSRLDFQIPREQLDRAMITEQINALITADHKITSRWISDEQLAVQPDLVRTMSVKPPTGSGTVRLIEIKDVDLQPCGGTHVASTREIRPIEVCKIENKGKQNRRVVVTFKSE